MKMKRQLKNFTKARQKKTDFCCTKASKNNQIKTTLKKKKDCILPAFLPFPSLLLFSLPVVSRCSLFSVRLRVETLFVL